MLFLNHTHTQFLHSPYNTEVLTSLCIYKVSQVTQNHWHIQPINLGANNLFCAYVCTMHTTSICEQCPEMVSENILRSLYSFIVMP
jgi:hypothetical protein